MPHHLTGKTIVFIATDGVEQVELTEPWKAVEQAGGRPLLVSPSKGEIQAFNHLAEADRFQASATPWDIHPDELDYLVLPGGVANPDRLRMDDGTVALVRSVVERGVPVGVICHGPWTLVEADVVRGRTLTSYPSLRTDIENAGGRWVDEEVCVDNGLVSSRGPHDLPAFCEKLVEELAEGLHEPGRVLSAKGSPRLG